METNVAKALNERRIVIERCLAKALASDADTEHLRKYERSLALLAQLLEHFPRKRAPVWLLPLSVVLVATSLIGVAASTRMAHPKLLVDARVSELTLQAAPGGAGLTAADEIKPRSIEVGGDAAIQTSLGRAISVSALTLQPGARATFEHAAGCLSVQLLAASVAGRGMIVAYLTSGGKGRMPQSDTAHLPAGASLKMCGEIGSNFLFLGQVSSLELSRLHSIDQYTGTPLRTASILDGHLKMPQIDRTVALQDTDLISLREMTNGWVAITLVPQMRIMFSGDVGQARSVALYQEVGSGVNLAPTVLEWLTKSPFNASVFGLLTGMIGMIWSAFRYFGFAAR